MEETTDFDLNAIAVECGLLDENNVDVVIRKINELEKKYSKEILTCIYNYFLSVSKNPEILTKILQIVSQEPEESSLNYIIDLIMDKEFSIGFRSECIKTIAKFRNTKAVPSLLYCLNDKNENYKIRLACADALGKIGDPFAVTPLINVVQDEEEKSVYVRESAATALGMLGDARAIDPLVSILETKKGFIDKFTFLKERAIEAISKLSLNSDRVLKALQHALMDESALVRINAIEALMELEDDRAYDLIKEMLEDLNEEVKKNALIALYNVRGREILDEVLENPLYCTFLKAEAQEMINEYENGDEDE